ncbi:hypothetical protein [Sorangium sp. So ce887]|uniref:hypothetical protein n=1 Tax=Sorangium sp. So ce887 TaxID=3133324 RepID=UPI003F6443AF
MLGTIAPERRILLVLHEAYEVPIVDVARALGINYNTATNRLRLAREDYRAAVARLRPEQRQALRAGWLVFPLASDFLVRDGGASAPAPAGVHRAMAHAAGDCSGQGDAGRRGPRPTTRSAQPDPDRAGAQPANALLDLHGRASLHSSALPRSAQCA